MTGRYEISVSFDGYYSFSLYVGSGAPLLTGTAHTTLPLCRKGIASVRLNSDAPLEDIADDVEAADGDTAPPPEEKEKMKCPKFTVTRDAEGMYRLTLYAKNGREVARSSPAATHGAALDMLDAIRRVAGDARTVEVGYVRRHL